MGKLNRSRHRDVEVVLRHPLRRRLLDLTLIGEPLDIADLADLTGESQARVRYHLHVLAECGRAPTERAGESLGDRTT